MTIGKLIISFAVFISIALFENTNPKLLKVILLGFILSFISSFFDRDFLFDISFLSFGFLVLIFLIYNIINKKWLPTLIALPILVLFIFKTQYWSYLSEIQTAMFIPVITYMIIIKNYKTYKNQIAILTILVAFAISEIIRLADYMMAAN
ncbi:hypothetical protein [uncultured Psychroserpens sp.]|uniref:hypothetical protein n=1 Tax=uncultured Psychroserpens sp. TaxID=255436 RepID=UPI00261708BC|nr:hypothetical protein [uncultured Psychroserpens sp.]